MQSGTLALITRMCYSSLGLEGLVWAFGSQQALRTLKFQKDEWMDGLKNE